MPVEEVKVILIMVSKEVFTLLPSMYFHHLTILFLPYFSFSRKNVLDISDKMLGHKLITKQTPTEGIMVQKIMIAESVNIIRETYVCILMDREHNGPVMVASPAGGVDIEAVAEKTPHLIKTVPVNINTGFKCEEM